MAEYNGNSRPTSMSQEATFNNKNARFSPILSHIDTADNTGHSDSRCHAMPCCSCASGSRQPPAAAAAAPLSCRFFRFSAALADVAQRLCVRRRRSAASRRLHSRTLSPCHALQIAAECHAAVFSLFATAGSRRRSYRRGHRFSGRQSVRFSAATPAALRAMPPVFSLYFSDMCLLQRRPRNIGLYSLHFAGHAG